MLHGTMAGSGLRSVETMEFYEASAFVGAIRPHFDPVALAYGMKGPCPKRARTPFHSCSASVTTVP